VRRQEVSGEARVFGHWDAGFLRLVAMRKGAI
jgi:hypothetical protein